MHVTASSVRVAVVRRILIINGANVPELMKDQEVKEKLEKGDKRRAGRLLSTFLREIAQEKITEIGGVPTAKIITKAHALANQIWDRALGNYQQVDKLGELKMLPPDKSMIELIFDRCEGRVGSEAEERDKDRTVPDRVSDANKQKILKIAQKAG